MRKSVKLITEEFLKISNFKLKGLIMCFLLVLFFSITALSTPFQLGSNSTVVWNTSNPPPMNGPSGMDYRDGIFITENSTLTIEGLTLAMKLASHIVVVNGSSLVVENVGAVRSLITIVGGARIVTNNGGTITFTESDFRPNFDQSIGSSEFTIEGTGSSFNLNSGSTFKFTGDLGIGGYLIRNGGSFNVTNSSVTASTIGLVNTFEINSGGTVTFDDSYFLYNNGSFLNSFLLEVIGSGILDVKNGSTIEGFGIVCLGSSTEEQYLQFPDPTSLNNKVNYEGTLNPIQPKVLLSNSTLKNTQRDNMLVSSNGGVIKVNNCVFQNVDVEKYCIIIQPYRSPSKPDVNACRIMESTFIWDNNVTAKGTFVGGYGIKLDEVSGVLIGGCTFTNVSNIPGSTFRGVGIEAYSSITGSNGGVDFGIAHSGDVFCQNTSELNCFDICNYNIAGPTTGGRNKFNQLDVGIQSITQSNAEYHTNIAIKFCDFTNNRKDIILKNGVAQILIQDNTFTGNRTTLMNNNQDITSTTEIKNIECVSTYPFNILNNIFNFTGTHISYINIIDPTHISYKSKIRGNKITNTSSTTIASNIVNGLFFSGLSNSTNLQIHCNEFYNLGSDIFIGTSGGFPDLKINLEAVKNQFSDILVGRLRINGGTFDYKMKTGLPINDQYNPQGYTTPNVTFSTNNERNCDLSCADLESDIVSINKIQLNESNLVLFPNPTNNSTNIEIYSGYIHEIQVFNANGKLVNRIKLETGKSNYNMDCSNFPAGLFNITIIDNDNNQFHKKLAIYK